jgi:non-heme chloroperoxidase
MLKTPSNPAGLAMDVFDQIRNSVLKDRSQYFKDLSVVFYGANRSGIKISEGLREYFWLQACKLG